MLSTIGRAAIRRIGGGASTSTNRALQSLWHLQRAERTQTSQSSGAQAVSWRFYATATKTASKPKTTKAKTTTKPKAKAVKSNGTAKAKAKKPVKKKVIKKKPAAKKALGRPKKVKVPLTDAQKLRAEIRQLKVKALLAEEPKGLPSTAWAVMLDRETKASTGNAITAATAASAKYKTLSPAEIEELNHEANASKARFATIHKQWVESHTPAAISEANNARRLLRRRTDTKAFRIIQDERIPKRATSAMLFFTKERHASGDLKGVGDFKTVAKLLTDEWKALSDADKKRYEDAAAADKNRYIQEFKTVFKRDSSAKPA